MNCWDGGGSIVDMRILSGFNRTNLRSERGNFTVNWGFQPVGTVPLSPPDAVAEREGSVHHPSHRSRPLGLVPSSSVSSGPSLGIATKFSPYAKAAKTIALDERALSLTL
jgi:hypothetical protein